MDEKLQDLLGGALKSLGVSGPVRDVQIAEIFSLVVGDALASMCSARGLERDCLVVTVRNSSLAHQLLLESPRLIEEINARLGAPVVRRFRFVPVG